MKPIFSPNCFDIVQSVWVKDVHLQDGRHGNGDDDPADKRVIMYNYVKILTVDAKMQLQR